MSSGSSKTTTDLKEIKQWAEERDGKPARVKGTGSDKEDDAGVLRINFPGYSGEDSLEEISWDEWFNTFEDRHLAFLYQDETSSGKESRFFKLVARQDKDKEHKGHDHKGKDHK